ncbi:putative permease [Desulfocapsa sulfexigens DSM 10523]|uniref:Putative permease n=1 Tax=Desulfocapsa sulfexigens (strain DSM 10523 / SB164P1) TaxID=1167006 RepID=M1P756_DESSD|nr:DMT family transporter [Desulfocapsa sulfexigens]AGF77512.1 putative permease [Desulfocapsa sulfexigens DSM 10523]
MEGGTIKIRGILLMLCASICFVTMATLVKALDDSLPLTELMFLRCLLAIPFLFASLMKRGKPLVARAWETLLLRTLFGAIAMFSFYYALTNMPLADCVFIGRTQPLLLVLAAPFIVGERAPKEAWVAVLCGLAGSLIIMRPGLDWSVASWVALLAAATSAIAHLLVRRLARTDDAGVIVFNVTVLLALISGILCYQRFQMPSWQQWGVIAGVSLLASSGQYLLTLAYRHDKAPAIAASSYASVVLSVLYGYFFWGEVPTLATWIGGLCIVTGGLWLVYSRIRSNTI